jgi:hypothetical protein
MWMVDRTLVGGSSQGMSTRVGQDILRPRSTLFPIVLLQEV